MGDCWQEWLSKRKPTVAARIRRLNPVPPLPGTRARGYHFQSISIWDHDLITPKQFIAEQGVVAYRASNPKLWRRRGLKKFMRRIDYLDNIWKIPNANN